MATNLLTAPQKDKKPAAVKGPKFNGTCHHCGMKGTELLIVGGRNPKIRQKNKQITQRQNLRQRVTNAPSMPFASQAATTVLNMKEKTHMNCWKKREGSHPKREGEMVRRIKCKAHLAWMTMSATTHTRSTNMNMTISIACKTDRLQQKAIQTLKACHAQNETANKKTSNATRYLLHVTKTCKKGSRMRYSNIMPEPKPCAEICTLVPKDIRMEK